MLMWEKYPALPAFPYCKRWKGGWGLGGRLVPRHSPVLQIPCKLKLTIIITTKLTIIGLENTWRPPYIEPVNRTTSQWSLLQLYGCATRRDVPPGGLPPPPPPPPPRPCVITNSSPHPRISQDKGCPNPIPRPFIPSMYHFTRGRKLPRSQTWMPPQHTFLSSFLLHLRTVTKS